MYLLIMVLDDSTKLSKVLTAWEDAGIRGVTILESTGINRVMTRAKAHPAMMGFSSLFGSGRVGHNTIFTVIESLDVAEKAVTATEVVVGSLNEPNTGIIFTVPVIKTWGMPDSTATNES